LHCKGPTTTVSRIIVLSYNMYIPTPTTITLRKAVDRCKTPPGEFKETFPGVELKTIAFHC
jgi:hypothetical protein